MKVNPAASVVAAPQPSRRITHRPGVDEVLLRNDNAHDSPVFYFSEVGHYEMSVFDSSEKFLVSSFEVI